MNEELRPKNLRLPAGVIEKAETLAYVRRYKRGVSELVERLIEAECRRKRGACDLQEAAR